MDQQHQILIFIRYLLEKDESEILSLGNFLIIESLLLNHYNFILEFTLTTFK